MRWPTTDSYGTWPHRGNGGWVILIHVAWWQCHGKLGTTLFLDRLAKALLATILILHTRLARCWQYITLCNLSLCPSWQVLTQENTFGCFTDARWTKLAEGSWVNTYEYNNNVHYYFLGLSLCLLYAFAKVLEIWLLIFLATNHQNIFCLDQSLNRP